MLKRNISISLRLTTWFGSVFLLGWLLFGASMWINLKSTLKSERRQTLTRRIDRLQELLTRNQNEAEADRYQDFKDFAHATGNGLSEVLRPDGERAYPSPSAAARAFPWPALRTGDGEQFVRVESAGQSYWVMSRSFSLDGGLVYLLAAAPEAGNLVVLHSFWRGLLASAPILLLVACLSGYWVSRRALEPVDRITATARSISIRNISERVPVSDSGDELQRLAETCNAMLERLESAVKQIKQFTADASHELRGPLSYTRTVAEVALRNPNADAESRRAFADIVDEAAKAAVLLEAMLTLARADAEPFSMHLEPVDLGAVIDEVRAMAAPMAEELGHTLRVLDDGVATVLGDSASLRRLLWILVDNALKYTRAGGTIEIALDADATRPSMMVRDNGIGIEPDDLPHIFDRFYRADPSRGMVEGNGLGLAIAKWIVETHRGEMTVESECGVGTTFRIVFPRATSRTVVGGGRMMVAAV